MASLVEPVCICQRCFRLQQYGQVEQSLRPGWSSHELLTPARFEELLGAVRESDAVVLCLVDLFDLQGSLLENLKSIAGHNPIVIAANKYDLLPRDASANRLVSWVHSEVKRVCDLSSPKEAEEERYEEIKARGYRRVSDDRESEAGVLRRSNVHLISSQSGLGVDKLLRSVMAMAADNGNKVYVMGAANVGKSSFINRMLDDSYGGKGGAGASKKKKRSDVPTATVSNLPGTTLDFLKIRLPNGVTMIDTPGLLTPGQLTAKLSPDELRQVVPSKPINAVTLRLSEGKCVLVGGIASVEMVEVRPSSFCVMVACVWRP
jgi:ribosome biogenesis GTPase A